MGVLSRSGGLMAEAFWVAGLRSWGRSIKPDRRHFGKDVAAGLRGAISSVPDGMASAVAHRS